MASSRFVFHPVLRINRSRSLLFYFLLLSGLVGSLSWYEFDQILKSAGLSAGLLDPTSAWYTTLLVSPYFRIGLIMGSAILGSSFTAHYVIGPVKRIEKWINKWKLGIDVDPLQVRRGDKFERMFQLLNELHTQYPNHKNIVASPAKPKGN